MRRPVRLQAGWEKPAEGKPDEAGQAGRFATRNVVRLSLVQREYVPARMLSRTAPESIASWNAAGTPGMLDRLGAARTLCPGLSENLGDS
jgi:hypothetical protein